MPGRRHGFLTGALGARCLFALLAAISAACSPAPTPEPSPAARAGPPPYTGLHSEVLGSYQARFEATFRGDFDWRYDLETRSDSRAVEYRLHMEGLSAARNPGDVRLVVQDGASRMHGPGTAGECVLFPSDLPQGPKFLSPDTLVDPAGLSAHLVPLQIETIGGVDTIHYTARWPALGEWRDGQVDLWRDESTGAVLRYELQATGRDPYFGAGAGALLGRFEVDAAGPQQIEPIPGCEIEFPLPAGSTRLIKLPGLIAFESASAPEQVSAFFQAELPASGWDLSAEPQASGDAILLSYLRAKQALDINIEPRPGGAHVELLLRAE